MHSCGVVHVIQAGRQALPCCKTTHASDESVLQDGYDSCQHVSASSSILESSYHTYHVSTSPDMLHAACR